ncbi:MAG: hypothetical protein IJZ83_08740 [Clostridia bacterium]|nr:hypothetical protein [Clostridia bacterium]
MKKLKLISLLCTFAMLISCFVVFPTFAAGEIASWATQGGTGTEGDPYILNQNNFAAFVSACNSVYNNASESNLGYTTAHYKLDSDIIVNEGNASEWSDSAKRPQNVMEHALLAYEFSGSFDGDGHTISGICMVGASNIGLFAQICGTVKNLRIENSYFEATGSQSTGALAKQMGSKWNNGIGYISNCYVDAIINCNTTSSIQAGGIVGETYGPNSATSTNAVIEKCVFAGEIIHGAGYAGGIVGRNNSDGTAATTTISNCLNLGSVKSTSGYAAPIAGRANATLSIKNSMNLSTDIQNTAQTYVSNMVGQIAGGSAANAPVVNFVVVNGIRANDANVFIASLGSGVWSGSVNAKSFAQIVDSENKVFADWDYTEGIPNPTTFDFDKASLQEIMSKLTATVLDLKSEGEIHSVRISADNPGLRFETLVNANVIDALKAAGATVTMKTYITAANFIGEDSETTTATFTKEALIEKGMPYLEVEANEYLRTVAEDGYTAFAGSVVNIKDKTMQYIAVGCITVTFGDASYDIYATWNANEKTSVSAVAAIAEADYSANEDAENKHVNLITTHSGASVYSRYTQEQYNIIVKLCCLQ